MANRKKTGNIVSMKRRRSKTLGVILCLFSLYLLVMFIMSMTKDHLSIYEVNDPWIDLTRRSIGEYAKGRIH